MKYSNTVHPSSTKSRERFFVLEAILGALIAVATVGAFQLHDATEELEAAVTARQEYGAIHDRSNARHRMVRQTIPNLRSAAVGNQ